MQLQMRKIPNSAISLSGSTVNIGTLPVANGGTEVTSGFYKWWNCSVFCRSQLLPMISLVFLLLHKES